ncbi:restriction endonuclease subunit S [Vibrio splendidus]
MVPSGWELTCLGDVADTTMGYAFKSKDFVKNGIPLIRMGNLYQNKLDLDRSPIFLPPEFSAEYERFLLKSGDLVMSMTGTMGKRDYGFTVQIPERTPDSLLNQRVMKFDNKTHSDLEYLKYLLRSETFLARLYAFPGGTKQANLSAKQVSAIPVLLPLLPEQRKIAKILSTWDKAISTTEKLIETSKQQKKALMQQLLTGKKRLVNPETGKNFDRRWEDALLNQLAVIAMGSSPKSEAYNEIGEGLPLLQGNADIKFRKSAPRIYTSQITKKCSVGDILLSVRAPVGSVAKSLHDACIGRGIASIQAKKNIVQEFVYQWLLSFEPKWGMFSQGSTFEAVNSNDIKTLQVSIPIFAEQQQIASVLTIADKEIEVLEAKLAHFKQEKKALMQQLLTGKRRVVVDAA